MDGGAGMMDLIPALQGRLAKLQRQPADPAGGLAIATGDAAGTLKD